VAILGLSISQLLGQNNPAPGRTIPSSTVLLRKFVELHGLDRSILKRFARFTYFYDGCRHFGISESGIGHRRVDELTFEATKECWDIGMEVWLQVLEVFEREAGSDLAQFDPRAYPSAYDEDEYYIPPFEDEKA
jgi:hypothetical protein